MDFDDASPYYLNVYDWLLKNMLKNNQSESLACAVGKVETFIILTGCICHNLIIKLKQFVLRLDLACFSFILSI